MNENVKCFTHGYVVHSFMIEQCKLFYSWLCTGLFDESHNCVPLSVYIFVCNSSEKDSCAKCTFENFVSNFCFAHVHYNLNKHVWFCQDLLLWFFVHSLFNHRRI